MIRHAIKTGLLLLTMQNTAEAALPATPFEPVYHALFSQHNDLAWQQLIILWPQLSSTTQRTMWWQALEGVISAQCGNDLPIAVPKWLVHPLLTLIQRDTPLNLIYRV